MKIAITNGEQGTNYITVAGEKVVAVTDHKHKERPHHNIEWKTEVSLENVLQLMKRLYRDEQSYRLPEDALISSPSLYLGKSDEIDKLRIYTPNIFFLTDDFISQVDTKDVYIGLLTPHYALNFYTDKSLKNGISAGMVSVCSNISYTLANIITSTSPHFADDAFIKFLIGVKLDDLLSQYPKPDKLN